MIISACMIVKNEAPIVARALESVRGLDEIIVVDTGSTDGTQDICRQFTPHVYEDYIWRDDFAEARNHAIGKATGDWIYSIDADHELISEAGLVRSECARAEHDNQRAVLVRSLMQGGEHWRECLFQNAPDIRWKGRVHEHLTVATQWRSRVVRRCGYSANHAADPERNLRILRASPDTARNRFYLARELYEHRRYSEAVEAFDRYLKAGKWLPEIAEAHFCKARCYWLMGLGSEARKSCLEAIRCNPDFREALAFMGDIHYEPWRSKWKRLAAAATNDGVLFVRHVEPEENRSDAKMERLRHDARADFC